MDNLNKSNAVFEVNYSALYLSCVMRKPAFRSCENKRDADQRLCFCYRDSTIPLLAKSDISSPQPSSMAVQPGLCRTWSKTPTTGFCYFSVHYHAMVLNALFLNTHETLSLFCHTMMQMNTMYMYYTEKGSPISLSYLGRFCRGVGVKQQIRHEC